MQDGRKHAGSVNEFEVDDTDENIRKKGMNCLISLTCTDQCSSDKVNRTTLGNPVAVDEDGLLINVDVQAIDDNLPTHEDKRQDVDNFFRNAVVKDVNGKSKKYRACKICP